MASENVKYCSKSLKRIAAQQMTQQSSNSNISFETTAEIVPSVENNTDQQFKQSDIALSGCSGPETNVVGACELTGRRIIDMAFFFEQVQELDSHSPRDAKCNFDTMVCYKEIRRGLASYFFFKCSVCGFQKQIASSRSGTRSGVKDINAAAVTASNKIGLGFKEAEQFFATMRIPFLNSAEFEKQQKILKRKE